MDKTLLGPVLGVIFGFGVLAFIVGVPSLIHELFLAGRCAAGYYSVENCQWMAREAVIMKPSAFERRSGDSV